MGGEILRLNGRQTLCFRARIAANYPYESVAEEALRRVSADQHHA
jgi:hypothetical protein